MTGGQEAKVEVVAVEWAGRRELSMWQRSSGIQNITGSRRTEIDNLIKNLILQSNVTTLVYSQVVSREQSQVDQQSVIIGSESAAHVDDCS